MNNFFQKAIKSNDPEEVNDFLIRLGKDPKREYISFIDYFIDKIDLPIFEKIKLNLIFILGEIGEKAQLDKKYLKFLEDVYYKSDRWVRNEIIQTLYRISTKTELLKDHLQIIRFSLTEDYDPVVINALNLLLSIQNVPNVILKNVIQILKTKNPEIFDKCTLVLQKFISDSNQLFYLLNDLDMYKSIKKNTIRSLLIAYFKSAITLEPFRKKIETARWDIDIKETYIKEIDTYERILLKNL
ncbi:MAG: hypothetical protein ACFFAN_11850 [Promethearchaeota archaeon]